MVYFAEVEIEADLNSPFNIRWNESTIRLQIDFNDAIKEGVASAYNCHLARGGASSAFTIEDMLISDVDTTPATVTVAATVAAWMALGHDESKITFSFDGNWSPHLPCSDQQSARKV